jgi:hypothetical protein
MSTKPSRKAPSSGRVAPTQHAKRDVVAIREKQECRERQAEKG